MYLSRLIITAGVLVLVMAGCADKTATGSTPLGDTSGAPELDVAALFGAWKLADAGEDSGAVLELGREASLRRECGALAGSWRADATGLFVAHLYAATGCPLPDEPDPAWLRAATSFRVDGDSRVLLNAQGGAVARLLPGVKPSGSAPAPGPSEPQRWSPAPTLPGGFTPARLDGLVGRWEPSGGRGAYLEFRRDGAWRGSDGCNGHGGRWVLGDGGALLAVGGASTLMGCDGVPVETWMTRARRAGLAGKALVLFDVDGKEIGRLTPSR